ncbi:glyoxylase-like metal-dependent hydrolase (beta-lactamase superfamily II) [Duganella sp. 1224]|uniref:MBL fold metallo-hydrolase n=1 Tax=Duganella sp. 1224 TaxID=2587052 RepID=UPI0015C9376B|nr:MBL fold metallo-hydrolase [Duganella sp. 1224]NYE62850.1 glyoxylase-like metal-dependent hydrolase (beta-lactamase superfamily II) [Duganella sp. 1224]
MLPEAIQVLQRGWLSSNNILLLGRHDTAIIDTGYVSHAQQTLELVRHVLHGRHLDQIINTHLHSDHCGGNAMLQAHFGCQTSIPVAEADKVRHWDVEALSFKATGQRCDRFTFDATIAPGDTLTLGDMAWQALAAPGHDPHALIFYCPQEKVLVSADALWENGFGVIFPELDGQSGFAEERATLDLIAGLDVAVVIPGHGAPFTDMAGALARARSRLDYLEADPVRNAQNALKVLLKFLLLERQRIALADVPALLTSMPVFAAANSNFLKQSPDQLGRWAVGQLVRSAAARVEGEYLLNQ